jgi:predicted RNA-binding Zn-ribbon protein involved in translation (DUF1610 family)
MGTCHSCGKSVAQKVVGRRDECPHCGAELYICLNCRFYDKWSSRECREPQAEPPREKDRANFCEFFEFGASGGGAPQEQSEAQKAAAAFDAMFKKR